MYVDRIIKIETTAEWSVLHWGVYFLDHDPIISDLNPSLQALRPVIFLGALIDLS